MSSDCSEHDIIQNKINVLLARNQHLVASWPTLKHKRTQKPSQSLKPDADIEKEEQETFVPRSDLLGFGADSVEDGDAKGEGPGENQKLCVQLLGKDYANKRQKGKKSNMAAQSSLAITKPRPGRTMPIDGGNSDDDGGRSSLGKSQRKKEATNSFLDGLLGAHPARKKKRRVDVDSVKSYSNLNEQEEACIA